ncbi:MAG: AAA family ATPase [Polyangiaceae bacterium]|nr:AAA family ATPase [Polyangiaceae bacterium]
MKIPYGTANFAKIRRKGYFYVDKTPFLPLLESAELGFSHLMFLRPRRMGKSALVSMLEHYYDRSWAGDFDALFRGLWVHEHPTPEKSSYLVLSLNYSQVASDGDHASLTRSFCEATKGGVRTFAMRYRAQIPELGDLYGDLNRYEDAGDLLTALFSIIAGTREQIYVLIDEYDTFANALLSDGKEDLYSAVTDRTGFVRSFYRTIKVGTETGAVERLFVTGASPILLDDLYTGFNIVTNISSRAQFNALAGFTRADVERAVDELLAARPDLASIAEVGDREDLLAVLEQYYNGYRFSPDATERVFNSDMVLYVLRELVSGGRFPMHMLDMNARTDYRKLHRLWAASGPAAEQRREMLEGILRDGCVWSELIEQFGRRGPSSTYQFVSLMYYTGMLTLSPEPPDGKEHRFVIPNRVIRELGWEHLAGLLRDLEGVELNDHPFKEALRAMATSGSIEPFIQVFHEQVVKAMGVKDLRQFNEKALKMMLLTCLVLTGIFDVLSEKELAQGYCDLFLSPAPGTRDARYAWMLEIKYLGATAKPEEIEEAFAAAGAQLARYTSDAALLPRVTQGKELRVGTIVFVSHKEAMFRPWAA